MTPESFAQAVQNTEMFTALRESMLAYPIILSSHLCTIAIFGGLILITDLRLLGAALTGIPAADIIRGTRPWKYVGFLLMISFGMLLGGAKLATYYDNPYFLIKLSLICMVGVHALIFRPRVYAHPEKLDALPGMPRVAKTAAVCSLVLWVSILSCGRWIAYYEKPDQNAPAARTLKK